MNGFFRKLKIRNSGLLYGFVLLIISDGRRLGKNLGWIGGLHQGSIRDFVRRNLFTMHKNNGGSYGHMEKYSHNR